MRNILSNLSDKNIFYLNINTDGIVIDCNKTIAQLHGFTCEDLLGLDYAKLCQQQGIKQWPALSPDTGMIEQAIQYNTKKVKWTIQLNSAGQDLEYICIGSSLPADSGVDRYQEAMKYVEQVKREIVGSKIKCPDTIEACLSLIINYLKNIIVQMPGSVYWKSTDGYYLGGNAEAAELVGLNSIEELVGKKDEDFKGLLNWPPNVVEAFQKDDSAILAGRMIINREEPPFINHEGKEIIQLTNRRPLYSEDGKEILGILGMSLDITQRSKLERALDQAKQKAEAASRAKSEFIANMSHDIRTPITGILGLAQSFADNAVTVNMRNDAEELISATKELLTLLNDILAMIEIESGRTQMVEQAFGLREFIDHNVKLIMPAINHKELKFSLSIDDDLNDSLYGNKRYLARIVLNLLSNAVKFTQQGFISIAVKRISQTSDKVTLSIAIKDSGIGIAKEKQEEIFDYLSKITPSYKGFYKGNGLGLSIVKQYLAAMNGNIHVDSEIGKGSCFTVTVSLKLSEKESTVEKRKKDVELVTQKVVERKSVKLALKALNASILVVEDNTLAARMLKQLLEKFNFAVDVAENGEVALQSVNDNHYDFIFMDIGLPGIDGLETTKRIRQLADSHKSSIPIVALTGHLSQQDIEPYLQIGMQAVLNKPLDNDTAVEVIAKFLMPSVKVANDVHSSRKNIFEGKVFASIDLQEGAKLVNGDYESAKEFLVMLAKGLPNDIVLFKSAYAADDYEQLQALAHRLHSGLCYCGTPRLRELAKTLNRKLYRGLQQSFDENAKLEVDKLLQELFIEADVVLDKIHHDVMAC